MEVKFVYLYILNDIYVLKMYKNKVLLCEKSLDKNCY